MATQLADNLNYLGPKPDFVRQQYDTVAEMAAVKDARMPELYLAYCLETQKVYLYKKRNTRDAVYGKFRIFSQYSYTEDSIQQELMPSPNVSILGKIYQYVGAASEVFKKGHFYLCSFSEDDGYFWEEVDTETIPVISIEEIDNLFNGG